MYENAKKQFDRFVRNNFDLGDAKILNKYEHTSYVVENAEYISRNLGLEKEDLQVAKVAALLHDIGRFRQIEQNQSFREDIFSYDHAMLGAQYLFEQGTIRDFILASDYDEIIRKAILFHSRYEIFRDDFNDKEWLHARILRDADKVDNFRMKSVEDIPTIADVTKEEIENSKLSEKVFADFMAEKTIYSRDRKTGIDIWVSYVAFLFGLEFLPSFELIKEKDYINRTFDRMEYRYEQTKMEQLRRKALAYLEKKLR